MSPSLSHAGKPHIFLLEDPAREKEHYSRYASKADAVEELSPLIDATYDVVLGGTLSPRSRAVLQAAAKSHFKVVYELATKRLVQLAHYFPEATELLHALAEDPNAAIRVRIIQAIWSDRPPLDSTMSLLRNGLRDKSSVVRRFASDRILLCDLRELAPDLDLALRNEHDPRVRDHMAEALALLRDGYCLKSTRKPGERELVVRMHRGVAARILPATECSHEAIQLLARKMQEEDLTRHRPKG